AAVDRRRSGRGGHDHAPGARGGHQQRARLARARSVPGDAASPDSHRGRVTSEAPLGVFDSGLGGLTVVRALRERCPNEDIIYLGDTARIPYGTRSAETVVRYALGCARMLPDRGVKPLLVLC